MQKQKLANPILTTDVFKNRAHQPQVVIDHALFKTPRLITKIFPSIGLPNFKEDANIEKCLFDIKKEGTYVHNLIRIMASMVSAARIEINNQTDRIQFLATKEEREKSRDKFFEMCKTSSILQELFSCIDPVNTDNVNDLIQMAEGKVVLKLQKDISDGSGKYAFRKGESLIKLIGKVKERCAAFGVEVATIDNTNEFKTFCKENIPNKRYSIIFSSDGEDGAWDLATMSMRGDWSSCQRWEGEYPRCLIGSILSKYIGIVYLTSGVMNSSTEKNGNRGNLGTKMMRRCIVRYAIDIDSDHDSKGCRPGAGKPCILIEKMYPDLDKDILSLFIAAIKQKSNLPVYYSPDLGNRLRHIYIPQEKIHEELSDRDLSYQDAPLKRKQDINVFMFSNSKEEVEREVRGFNVNLSNFLARKLEQIYSGYLSVNDEVRKIVSNIRMNTQFTTFCDQLVHQLLGVFRAPSSTSFTSSKLYYRQYLREILIKRKQMFFSAQKTLTEFIAQNTSRKIDANVFIEYVMSILVEFTKLEARKMVS